MSGLRAAGVLRDGGRVASGAVRVRTGRGAPAVIDVPVEPEEAVRSWLLVDADDLDAAVSLAQSCLPRPRGDARPAGGPGQTRPRRRPGPVRHPRPPGLGRAAARGLVDDLISRDLARYPLAWATRADMLRRLGRYQDSAAEYRQAPALTGNGSERRFLTGRAERSDRGTDQEVG